MKAKEAGPHLLSIFSHPSKNLVSVAGEIDARNIEEFLAFCSKAFEKLIAPAGANP